jgi:hypothetical protein
VTTLTLRCVRGEFLVAGPDIEPGSSSLVGPPRTGVPRTIPTLPQRRLGGAPPSGPYGHRRGNSEPGRSPDWLKFKNPEAPAVRREAEENWRK